MLSAANTCSFPNSGGLLTWGLNAYRGFLGGLREVPNPQIWKISCGWKNFMWLGLEFFFWEEEPELSSNVQWVQDPE